MEQTEKVDNVEQTELQKKKNGVSATKKLVVTAVFSALAYCMSFLEFPLFTATPFLKLDFSAVFILLVGFMFGAIYGVSACAVKELVCFLTKSSTGGVGEIANFIVISAFILVPSLVYQYKKGLKSVTITLIIACVIQVALSLVVNRYINFPLFMKDQAAQVFAGVWGFIVLFNFIKSVAISVLTIILYKRISGFIKRI